MVCREDSFPKFPDTLVCKLFVQADNPTVIIRTTTNRKLFLSISHIISTFMSRLKFGSGKPVAPFTFNKARMGFCSGWLQRGCQKSHQKGKFRQFYTTGL
jgi:hypothetical protein